MESYDIIIRRMPALAWTWSCAVLILHFLCCIPAMTCRMNADVGFSWIIIAPYIAYSFLVFIPLFDDRSRTVYGASIPIVVAMLFINAAVSENLNSARPHPGAQGVTAFMRGDWPSILLDFVMHAPIAIFLTVLALFGSVQYWHKRRAFSESPGRTQFSTRTMFYLVVWVSLYCGLFTWMIGSR